MKEKRIIALIDMDCFYVQVEQRFQPQLYDKPVAVVQHSSVNYRGGGLLAVSYEARLCGVKRGMFAEQAKAVCPNLMLCYVPSGEHVDKADITRYREASSEVFKILHEFDSRIVVERASVDEAYLDLTALVEHIFRTTDVASKYAKADAIDSFPTTHVADGTDINVEEASDWNYDRINSLCSHLSEACETKNEHKLKLFIGADEIEKIRKKIKKDTTFNCSAGIGSSKMIAKLVCSRHKPAQQTVVFDDAIPQVFKYTSISEVRNLGGKLGKALMERFNIKTMGELSNLSAPSLSEYFPSQATWIHSIARGFDEEKVIARDKQSSVAVSKNFPGPNALKTDSDVRFWLEGLIKELVKRLVEDQIKNNRTASTLHIGCTIDTHVTRSIQIKTYDPKALFTSVWSVFRLLNKSVALKTWNPSVKNIMLSADRFRDGIDSRSKQITEWVIKLTDMVSPVPIASTSGTNVENLGKSSKENKTSLKFPKESYSLRCISENDDDIQIIGQEVGKKYITCDRSKIIGRRRKKVKTKKLSSPKKKISDFFKKQ